MSVSETPQSFSARKSSCSMKLPLHRSGDRDGNAFPVSSSSSSSSFLGESSPESLRSLSSLSGGRMDSPQEYDLLEVTLMTAVLPGEKNKDVVLSKWSPEEEEEDDDEEGTFQTESDDVSVSVYLDASSGDYHQQTWNHGLTLSLEAQDGCHFNEDVTTGSSIVDSDATEIPADDDDDDEEAAMFLSVSSDVCTRLAQVSPGGAADDELGSEQLQTGLDCPAPSLGCRENAQICGSLPPSDSPDKDLADVTEIAGTQIITQIKKAPKPLKARTGSHNMSPSKAPPQNKPVAVSTRRAVPRKDEVEAIKKSAPGPIKVAVILRSTRGKGANVKANHKVAAGSNTAHPEKKKTASIGLCDPPWNAGRDLQEGLEGKGQSAAREKELLSQASMTDATEEQRRSPTKRVSSRLGPGVRQQGRTARPDRGPAAPPGSGTGPPGQESSEQGTSEYEVGDADARNQNQGIPKPRVSGIGFIPTASVPKPATSQQPAAGPSGRQPAPTASKLPVKGSPSSLGCSSQGSNEKNFAVSKAPSPTRSKPDELRSRGLLQSSSQSTTKPPSCGISGPPLTSSTSTSSDIPSSAASKPPAAGLRSRAPSGPARTSATGLKTPTVTNQNTTKTPAGQPSAKTAPSAFVGPTKPPPQRNGSTRPSRLSSTVDKNKPREAPTKPSSTSPQITTGNQQNPQLHPPEPVPDVLNANTPTSPALPVPALDGSNTTPGPAGPAGPGLKARTGSRSSPKHGGRPQHASRPGVGGTAAPVTAKQNQNKEQVERKNQALVQLRRLLVQGNRKVEALAAVIQHLFSEREETLKQKKELSSELSKLREELVSSSQCCQSLQAEKEEVRTNLEAALKRLEEQHEEELVQLENRLKCFYQAEWDKVHQLYQQEADKCRLLMEQQVEELRSQQEAERKRQEESHSQKMEAIKQEYETSIQEMKRIQQTELEDLQKTLKETQTSLTEKVSALSAENEDLSEKLRAEEERRQRILSDKNVKDSHTLYLEQELESLKVVLEIKTNQLHQKEKKLMEMDKLVETNVRLEEVLKKVQQENEDYKARMDKHAALSKQLSTEQAILQQTLQKESKVNKRLSMENEELLWKLHNSDLLGSPRRLSPTSPYSSPRNSASFPTAATLSPR
ncbi:microtubule-associated tumor suppressor 1 homolog [Cyprinodon tularosa]|uniref:microtubule-associated tumor suppressor 1 homolog n=1 Tax=Cyprinodon tularosa TaxID=77115 RepID=UPI0018E2719A|nr:microtubule-associated tumor suppressor 1 homolog [Cyprinodon tularosa]XP_038144104.1 microtubule-associated tumor suppressor 1 homolog [Cyprinodon tularosa]